MLLDVDHKLQADLICGNETPKNSKQENVLSVTIENKLNLATNLVNTAKRSKKKFNALTRVQKNIATYIFYSDLFMFFIIKAYLLKAYVY